MTRVFLSYWCVSRSIHKFKACLKFCGFFATLKMTNPPSFLNGEVRFLCPSLRASKASVAIHKFSQKFKQILKTPKNSANHPQAHHKKIQWIATNLHAYALQILAMTKIPCHTERSEVSINLKCDFSALRRILNSVDFSPFYKRLKMTKFCRHCELFFSKTARWQLYKWHNDYFVKQRYENSFQMALRLLFQTACEFFAVWSINEA